MQRSYVCLTPGVFTEMTSYVLRQGWTTDEKAEEGAVGQWTVTIADPGMTFDFSGYMRWVVVEDESEATDTVVFHGSVADQKISRGDQGELFEPLGRVWELTIVDENSRWGRRVMTGSDCNRPAESDVTRMQWLFTTNEATYGTYLGDATTYVSTASPVAMDAADYRGQMFNAVVDDCAQASGKNWFIWTRYDPTHTFTADDYCATAWYGKDNLSAYSSTLSLSNDPADWTDASLLDGTSLAWPISEDTTLSRDPSRIFTGVYLPYEGGAVYRESAPLTLTIPHRDSIMPSANVKTSAKAIARAIRYLADLAEQDERITTTVELPKGKATMIRTGMRIPFKATHLPGYEAFRECRILDCQASPVAGGSRYRLALEMVPIGATLASCSTVVSAATTAHTDNQTYSAGNVSLAITPPSGAAVVFAGLIASDNNTPGDSAMAGTGSWTTMASLDINTYPSINPSGAAVYQAVSGATTVTGSYTGGFSAAGSSHWGVCAAGIATSATAPVQEAHAAVYQATLASTPTPGNLLVMVASIRATPTMPAYPEPADPTLWTKLVDTFTGASSAGTAAGIYVRCVQAGDGKTWGFTGISNGMAVSVSEWALT